MGTKTVWSSVQVSPKKHEIERRVGSRPEVVVGWVVSPRSHGWQPPTDVFETETHIVVKVEVAGMRHADFHISLSDRHLTIGGGRHGSSEQRAYHQMEVHYGEFRRDIELPAPVDADRIEATYEDGLLRISLPKKITSHRIQVDR